jgi:hypothetical protein
MMDLQFRYKKLFKNVSTKDITDIALVKLSTMSFIEGIFTSNCKDNNSRKMCRAYH